MRAKGGCLAAIAASILALAGCTEKPRVLRLCIWKDDFSPQMIEAFERKYGCVVRLETFDSNEAMVERLRTEGPDCCDLIEPSSYIVGQLAQEGLIVPIDHTKCPSVKRNFCWDYVKTIPEDPELEYAVPYNISASGFILSCEEFAVTAGCREPGLAHAFLEFLYSDPEIGCDYMNFRCALLPSLPAIGILDPEFRKLVEPSPEILARGQVLKGFDEKPETQVLYERAWERIVRER